MIAKHSLKKYINILFNIFIMNETLDMNWVRAVIIIYKVPETLQTISKLLTIVVKVINLFVI